MATYKQAERALLDALVSNAQTARDAGADVQAMAAASCEKLTNALWTLRPQRKG